MSKEYEQVMVAHPQYKQNIGRWRYLANSFLGGVQYAKAGYLQKYSYETDIEYQQRINSTPLDNQCKGIVNIYNAFLFREECDREFGSLNMDPAVVEFLDDADLEGRSLNAFMKDVSTYSSVYGNVWVMLVKPQTNARTRADELQQGVRPYAALVLPTNVLDWRYRRAPNGVYFLEYLKYIEDNDDPRETVIREWTEFEIITTVTNDEKKSILNQIVEINELGKIPAVCVYNQRGTQRGIGVSDIEDIARQQQLVYNLYSEIDQSTKLNGHPSLVKTAGTEAAAGPGAIVQIEDNLDPGLKPYMLSVANDTGSMWNSVQNIVESIDRMANTAAVRAKSTRVLSGVAMEVEFSMLNARLSEKADNLELAEEQMWRLFAEYQGTQWDGSIDYPDSFSIHDKQNDFQNLQTAKSAATDPIVLKTIDGELLELMGYEKEMLPYADPVPQPGRVYPDGEAIPDSLPIAYMDSASPEVPEGQNCSNCEYYKATDGYCVKFDAPVRGVWWCAKWDEKSPD
jgi:hypothetical protein